VVKVALIPWLWPAACALVLAAPIVLVAMPPMVDFPAHEAVVGVLRHRGDASFFPSDLYVLNWGHPNQLQYLLAWPLAYVVGTTKALELVVALAVGSIVFGAARLARHLGKPAWTCLLAAPVAVGWNLHWGHIANLLGLGALLWMLPDLDRFARSPRWGHVPAVLAYFVFLYCAHEGVLVVAVAAVALFSLAYGGNLASFVLRAAPCVAIAAGAFIQLKVQHLSLVNEAYLTAFSTTRVRMIPSTIVGFYDLQVGPYVFDFIGIVVVLNAARAFLPAQKEKPSRADPGPTPVTSRWRALAQRHRFVVLGVVLLAAFFVLPPSYNGVLFFFHRFLPMAWCILVVATTASTGAPGERASRLVCAAVPAAMLALILPPFIASHVAYRQLDALLPAVEKGSGIFSADLDVELMNAINRQGFSARNAQGHIVAKRGGRALADYTQSPISPALVNPAYAWQVIAKDTYIRPSNFRPKLIFASFRYVVLHVADASLALLTQAALDRDARLIAQDSAWLVFESSILETKSLDEAEPKISFDPQDTLGSRIREIASGVLGDRPPQSGGPGEP